MSTTRITDLIGIVRNSHNASKINQPSQDDPQIVMSDNRLKN